jgi:hypothetical protein
MTVARRGGATTQHPMPVRQARPLTDRHFPAC